MIEHSAGEFAMEGTTKRSSSHTTHCMNEDDSGCPLSSSPEHSDVIDDWLDSIDERHWPALYDHLRQGAAQMQREFALIDHDCDEQTAQSVAILVCCAAAHELAPMELYCLLELPQRSTSNGYARLQLGSVLSEQHGYKKSASGRDARRGESQDADSILANDAYRPDVSSQHSASLDEPRRPSRSSRSGTIEHKGT